MGSFTTRGKNKRGRSFLQNTFLAACVIAAAPQTVFAWDWVKPIPAEHNIPAPPPHGSSTERSEIAEILHLSASASPEQLAAAKQDNDTENATIFAQAIGPDWKLENLPRTKFLMDRIMDVDSEESDISKSYFKRPRPWIVDARVHTCAPHEIGPALNAYPSGHTLMAYELGVVLASLMPNHSKEILVRAKQYSENRIVCGFHFRSDVEAGRQFGTLVANRLMQNPSFAVWFKQAQNELRAAGLSR